MSSLLEWLCSSLAENSIYITTCHCLLLWPLLLELDSLVLLFQTSNIRMLIVETQTQDQLRQFLVSCSFYLPNVSQVANSSLRRNSWEDTILTHSTLLVLRDYGDAPSTLLSYLFSNKSKIVKVKCANMDILKTQSLHSSK